MSECELCGEMVAGDELNDAGWCKKCQAIIRKAHEKNYPEGK